MSGDIIEAIDGALSDWATSDDAMRWTPNPPQNVRSLPVAPHLNPEAFASMTEALRRVGDEMRRWAELIGPVAAKLAEALQRELRLSDDRRTRALQLRQHRHTGPPVPRMDGRR